MKFYQDEVSGQREFYSRIGLNPDLSHYTDGVDKGNLYENKLSIDNIHKALFQAVKYASSIRERGELLPANLILNDLNKEVVYIYQSSDLMLDIEKIYFGAASKGNDNFTTSATYKTIDYSTPTGLKELLEYVESENYVKYHIDRTNILGLAYQFYKYHQDKDMFIKGKDAEVRKPRVIGDRAIPYDKPDNSEFGDIMDCLNPALLQREIGAYYTPQPYVDKMHEMLFRAISEVPKGMDYIIIDRCAGVGNLEYGLPDDVLEHCVLSTIEFNEYQLLRWKFGSKSAVVIPNVDALEYDIIPARRDDNGDTVDDYIRDRVNDENCVVILMENPPFSEVAAGSVQGSGIKQNAWKNSWVCEEMKKEIKGSGTNDLSNLFIWSGFKYYLRSPKDSYILYSPIKYWSFQNIISPNFVDGFLGDRRNFHANQGSAISCIWWRNVEDKDLASISMTPYDIKGDNTIRATDDVEVKKAYTLISTNYDTRAFPTDEVGIVCESNGLEAVDHGRAQVRVKPLFNENIVAYMVAAGFSIDRKHVYLTRCGIRYGNGFYLRSDNYIEKLPLFIAAAFPYDKWYKTDIYAKTYDGQGTFLEDEEFLKKCLLYTALTPKNKCRSFLGSDGRFYKNELCLDAGTLSSQALKAYSLTEYENTLIKYWGDVKFEAEKTAEYKALLGRWPDITFGLWQIMEELNIKIPSGKRDKFGNDILTHKYTALNTEINKLNNALKEYYNEQIIPSLFRYQLIK